MKTASPSSVKSGKEECANNVEKLKPIILDDLSPVDQDVSVSVDEAR